MMNDSVKFLIIFFILLSCVLIKYNFFLHPNRQFFLLSNSDIMLKAPEFLKKPTPIPYVQSYIEYPALVGIWNTFIAYFSYNARDFFLLNGIFLSFFSAVNIFLAREISRLYFKREITVFKFLTPSVIFFTFYNWDVLAVFFLLSSLLLIFRNNHISASFLASLGFWLKLFPGFVLMSVGFSYLRQRKFFLLLMISLVFVLVSIILNLRFYLLSPQGWGLFFKFSSGRPPNIDSVWSGLYSISDKVFGVSFYYKRYYDQLVNYLSVGLFAILVLYYYLKKIMNHKTVNLIYEVGLVISLLLLTSKVYSPQYNLWVVLLFVVIGVSYKKIIVFEVLNVLLTWVVFQYFQEVYIVGRQILTFPLFKLTYVLTLSRQVMLALLTLEVWRLVFPKYEKIN